MRANNITISVPGKCTRKCPYCVSEMTFPVEVNFFRFKDKLPKLAALARRIQSTHILITGKGEPFDNLPAIMAVLDNFNDFWIEVQTHLTDFNLDQLSLLKYLDVLAISIDNPDIFKLDRWSELASKSAPWIVRATVILSTRFKMWDLLDFVWVCQRLGIRQLTIRQPSVPLTIEGTPESLKTMEWIKNNTDPNHFASLVEQLRNCYDTGKAVKVRDLNFGPSVYTIYGVSVTLIENCVESYSKDDEFRSLIYQGDGHLYTTWDSKGSILW